MFTKEHLYMLTTKPVEKGALKIIFKLFVLLITLSLTPGKIIAQNSEIGNWFIYFGNQRINKK